jgi:hypothetical protein
VKDDNFYASHQTTISKSANQVTAYEYAMGEFLKDLGDTNKKKAGV